MVKMIATRPHVYGGKRLQVGDEYNAGARHARLMKALGRADRAPVYVAPPPAPVEKTRQPRKAAQADAEPAEAKSTPLFAAQPYAPALPAAAADPEPESKALAAEDEQGDATPNRGRYKTRNLTAE